MTLSLVGTASPSSGFSWVLAGVVWSAIVSPCQNSENSFASSSGSPMSSWSSDRTVSTAATVGLSGSGQFRGPREGVNTVRRGSSSSGRPSRLSNAGSLKPPHAETLRRVSTGKSTCGVTLYKSWRPGADPDRGRPFDVTPALPGHFSDHMLVNCPTTKKKKKRNTRDNRYSTIPL